MRERYAEVIETFYGFRKVLVMGLVLLIGVIFRIKNLIDGQQMTDLVKATSLAFFAANSAEYINLNVKQYLQNNSAALINQVKKDL